MEIADPYSLKLYKPTTAIYSDFRQERNKDRAVCEQAGNFRDEFFVVTRGIDTLPHADITSQLASQATVWGYELIRKKMFYWNDKNKLIFRIFRSTNISLWQKRRETGFEDGLAAVMSLIVTTSQVVRIGTVGNIRVAVVYNNSVIRQTSEDIDHHGVLTNMLGIRRYGLKPHIYEAPLLPGTTVLILTPGIYKYTGEDEILRIVAKAPAGKTGCSEIAENLIVQCQKNGSEDEKTVYVIKYDRPVT